MKIHIVSIYSRGHSQTFLIQVPEGEVPKVDLDKLAQTANVNKGVTIAIG